MQTPNRLFLVALVLLAVSASAQTLAGDADSANPRNPPMTSMRRDSDKETLYSRYLANKKIPIKENQRLAYIAAKEFVTSYGGDNDPYLPALRRFVTEYEKVVREFELQKAYNSKAYSQAFEIGRAILKSEPENFLVLAVLTQAGFDNAASGNTALNTETLNYAQRAILALESGRVTKPDPFTTMDTGRAYLQVTVGSLLKDQKPDEAAAAFREALLLDSPYRKDPGTYYRLGVSLLKGEFAQLSAEYNQKFGNKEPSPEQQAMLEKLNHLGQRAIDAYARAVALSTTPPQQDARGKILAQLIALYKTFNNNSDAGLDELIANVLAKPLP